MQFTQPAFFYLALALIPLLAAAAAWGIWRRRREWRAFAQPASAAKLAAHLSPGRDALRAAALAAGLILLALALAGPQWGSKMVEVRRRGVDVIIALDVSRSMLAEDIKPNRLQRAQQELSALIDRLNGDRVGVVAFAGAAQVACPLTSDYAAAKMFMNYLTPESVAVPGTSLGDAVRTAIQSYPQGGEGYRVLVLLTDGEDHRSDPLAAARAAKEAGVRILTVGFGTPGGEPIPLRDDSGRVTGYLKDAAGQSVVSKLDEDLLKQIAETTEGAYWPAAGGTLEAERMAELIGRMQKRDLTAGKYGAAEDRFQFVLVPALLCLLFAAWLPRRRGAWLVVLALALMGARPAAAEPGREINRGNAHYAKRQFHQALQDYQDAQIKNPESPIVQYDLGNALQQLGKPAEAETAYRQALKSPERSVRARAWYNLGNNALAQEKFPEAVEAYREALRLTPGDPDVLNNLALSLRFQKRPPEKKPQDQNGQNPQPGQNGQGQNGEARQNAAAKLGSSDQKPKGPDDRGEQKAGADVKSEAGGADGGDVRRAPKPGEMSPEDAANLLDAARESEQEAQRRRGIRNGQSRKNGQEDW